MGHAHTPSCSLSCDGMFSCPKRAKACPDRTARASDNCLSFVFAGDLMCPPAMVKAALRDPAGPLHFFTQCFSHTSDLINSADIAVANLECPLDPFPFTTANSFAAHPYRHPRTHTGIRFSAPSAFAQAIRGAGFRVLSTANNHAMDAGEAGLRSTVDLLDDYGLVHVGTRHGAHRQSALHRAVFIEHNGIRVALLAYTFGLNLRPRSGQQKDMVSVLDEDPVHREVMCREVTAARAHADKVIALMHFGQEGTFAPVELQKVKCEWLLDCGVDIVVGSHPHAPQPMEYRQPGTPQERLIAWSLGDALAHYEGWHLQNRGKARVGAWLGFLLYRNDRGDMRLRNVGYRLSWRHHRVTGGRAVWRIMPVPGGGGEAVSARDLEGLTDEEAEDVLQSTRAVRELYEQQNVNVNEFPS